MNTKIKNVNVNEKSTSGPGIVAGRIRWSEGRLLEEARLRTKDLFLDDPKKVMKMLADLLPKSGWDESEFITILCRDIIAKNKEKSKK